MNDDNELFDQIREVQRLIAADPDKSRNISSGMFMLMMNLVKCSQLLQAFVDRTNRSPNRMRNRDGMDDLLNEAEQPLRDIETRHEIREFLKRYRDAGNSREAL